MSMQEMPERIWVGNDGRYSTIRLLKKPILGIPADVEYVRADLSTKNEKPITEYPDVQRLTTQNVQLQAENRKLKICANDGTYLKALAEQNVNLMAEIKQLKASRE